MLGCSVVVGASVCDALGCLAVRLSWLMLFVLLWAITGVLGCSVVLAYAVCGAWLGLVGAWLFGCLGWFNLWGLVGL